MLAGCPEDDIRPSEREQEAERKELRLRV